MKIDVKGRLRNINLGADKALMPLFEAIVNSIHAIEDLGIDNGVINIFVNRQDQLAVLDIGELPYIDGFTIIDNGVGFNEENYTSFQTSDTILKLARGSKGIGRFIWLKVFSRVSISSVFKEGDKFIRRTFEFTPTGEGISEHSIKDTTESKLSTSVSLKLFENKYKKKCPRKTEIISKRIIEHCIEFFMLDNCPEIIIHDYHEKVHLNQYFEVQLKNGLKISNFDISGYSFTLKSLMFYDSQERNHTINYCANSRLVESEKITNYITDLTDDKKIKDLEGKSFIYFAYITSEFLDENVNSERTEFCILKNREYSLDFEEIYFDLIRQKALDIIKAELLPYLREITEVKKQEISNYVYSEAPYYRPLLKYAPDLLDKIPPNLSKEKLDIELHRNMLEYEITLKEQGQQVLTNLDRPDFSNYTEYQEQYYKFLEQYNDLGAANLSKYVVHRKIIIDIFEKSLEKDDNGKYRLEKDIHKIIFPLNATSDGIQFEMHNLWIVDEKLSYHQYLASDRPLKTIENLSVESAERPDVVIFNNPVAFVEGELNQPYSSIVILEFKRPMRESYGADENPITQVQGYIEKMQSGSYKDKNGRLITLPTGIPFYGYIICDLTAEIVSFAKNGGLTRTPDLQGYFGFNNNFNSYIEIMSFEKLIGDAKKRNQILFRKLNLP